MPRSRTSFEDQAAAVARLAAKNRDPAIQDAIATIAAMKKIAQECRQENPDDEKVAAILVDLIVGS
jgi:hypothetical protein